MTEITRANHHENTSAGFRVCTLFKVWLLLESSNSSMALENWASLKYSVMPRKNKDIVDFSVAPEIWGSLTKLNTHSWSIHIKQFIFLWLACQTRITSRILPFTNFLNYGVFFSFGLHSLMSLSAIQCILNACWGCLCQLSKWKDLLKVVFWAGIIQSKTLPFLLAKMQTHYSS